MINLKGTLKKIEVVPAKQDSKGEIKNPKLVRFTFEAEYTNISDAEYGNLALAQGNEDEIEIKLDARQLLIEFDGKSDI